MHLALEEAFWTGARGEVPIGAVAVHRDGRILARAGNAPITRRDPTAHAEILALRRAGEVLGNYRLPEVFLVVTLEPCLMCLGAMIHARLAGLVFGAKDPKTGAITSRLPGPELPFLNHRLPWHEGVLAEDCGRLLRGFFRRRRGMARPASHSSPAPPTAEFPLAPPAEML